MREDWVLVTFPDYDGVEICKAPRWSGLEIGDLVKVDGLSPKGTVQGSITIDPEDEALVHFIEYLSDQNEPMRKILEVYRSKKLRWEEEE